MDDTFITRYMYKTILILIHLLLPLLRGLGTVNILKWERPCCLYTFTERGIWVEQIIDLKEGGQSPH